MVDSVDKHVNEDLLRYYVLDATQCGHCGSKNIIYRYHGSHVAADCGDCWRTIKFLKKKVNALRDWEKAVKGEYNYTCAMCGRVLEPIEAEAHHKLPKALFPQYALDLSNGICLCKQCHRQIHGNNKDGKIANG